MEKPTRIQRKRTKGWKMPKVGLCLFKHEGKEGFWLAMGSVRLAETGFRIEGDTIRQIEISPRIEYDRNGRQCTETDWQFIEVRP